MKTIVNPLLIAFCIVLMVPSLSAQFGDGWEFIKEKDDISVWTKPSENSSFKKVLIKSNFDATLSTLVLIGRDVKSYPDWVFRNIGSSLVATESKQSLIYHSVSDMPWPMEDRDAVVRNTVRQDPVTKKVYIDSKMVQNHPYSKEGVVRAKDYHAQWVLSPLENGQVEVLLCVFAEPGGSIPAWLANLFLDKGPIETFLSIRRLSKLEPYKSATFDFIENQ